jgi:thiosulfate/3-mercaptopyruvate sulfurtransferase
MSLISVDHLAARLEDDNLRLADVRWYLGRPGAGRAAYDAGHIPGAIFVDLETDLSDPQGFGAPGRHPLPSPDEFRRRMSNIGIGSDTFVVGYDDSGGTIAARLWWMLDNLGHHGVAVLDGGMAAWVAAGQPLSTEPGRYPPANLVLAQQWRNVIARQDLASRLGMISLLDARAPERYRGEVEPIDPVAGHIPTAINAPTTGNLGADSRFLSPAALRARFGALTRPGAAVVNTCGSGTTACHNSLAMRLAGLPDPILYVGSYSDWSRSGMPVLTGPEPGSPEQAKR